MPAKPRRRALPTRVVHRRCTERAHSLWMTLSGRARHAASWLGAVVPKRHARARGDAQPAQAPDPRRGGSASTRAGRAACGWCACARRSTARRFVSAASDALAQRRPRRARRPASQRARRARRQRPARHARLGCAACRSALLIALVRGYRLLLEPVAGQRLPLRADLLGLCARGAASGTAPPAAATWRRGACCAATRGAHGGLRSGAARSAALPRLLRPRHPPPPSTRRSHERYSPHPAVGGVLDVAGPAVGRLEQAHRPAVDVRRRRRAAAGGGAGAAGAGAPARRRRAGTAPRAGADRGAGGRRRRAGAPPARGAAPPAEQVTITTDVVKATFDSRGGDLVRLELLQQRRPARPPAATWCCSTAVARARCTSAQTGPDRARRPASRCPTT